MSFGNPMFLWGLLAVPLPVLIHLFFRRRKASVDFSTLQFFHRQKRYLAHRRKLRELLLLLVRTLALLCLVLALSRTLLQRLPTVLASHTDTAILIDDTLSMDRKLGSGATAFELATQKAGEILNTLADGDAVALVFLSGRPGIALTRKRQLVRQLLETARVTGATGSFRAGLKQALDDMSAGGLPNREIFVISDFQANQAPSEPVATDAAKGTRIYFLPVSGSPENLSISPIQLSSRPLMAHKRMVIPYEIQNHGDRPRDTEASLVIDTETVRSENVTVPPHGTVKGRFEYVPAQAGILSGSVRIDDRQLELDNRRFFTVNVCENIRVLLLESDVLSRVRPFYFLKLAVDPAPGEAINGIQTDPGFVTELTDKTLEKCHVVALANPSSLPPPAAAILTRYMESGGTVLVFAGNTASAAVFGAFGEEKWKGLWSEREPSAFNGLTFKGPLAKLNGLLQLDLVKWRHPYVLKPTSTSVELAESCGHALMLEEKVGAGSLIVCGFSIRRDTGNWPELKSFPIAMIHLLTYAAHDPMQKAGIACGNPLKLTALAPPPLRIVLRRAGGTPTDIAVEKGEAVFTDTWSPGILTADRASPRSVAINTVPRESELTQLGSARLSRLVEGPVSVLRTDAALDTQIRNYRRGSDLTGLLLVCVILLLLVETWLGNARPSAGKTRPPAETASPPQP